ncbi:MAG: hydrogenase/urease maturation nickel metallochaperone HypA [Candidatus Nanohaloarchaea archaeon]
MDKVGNAVIKAMQDLSRISTNGSARIRVNRNLCEPEAFETIFEHFSRGTILERIDLDVETMDTKMECGGCGHSRTVEGEHSGYEKCPSCGRFAEIKDNAYELVEPNPNKAGIRKSIRF